MPDEQEVVAELRKHVHKPRETVGEAHEVVIKMSLSEAALLLSAIERLSGESQQPTAFDTLEW